MKRRHPPGERTRGEELANPPTFAGKLRARRPLRPARLRVACGVLAAGLLGMLAIGTLREASAVYREPWPAGASELHMPSLPPPPFPKELGPDGEVKERVRFLLHVVVAPQDFGLEARPRLVREIDIEWPRDRGRVIECRVDSLRGELSRRLELEEVQSGTFTPRPMRRRENLETAYDWMLLRFSGSEKLAAGGGSWYSSSFEDFTVSWRGAAERIGIQDGKAEYGWGGSLGRSFGSLVPRRVPARFAFGVVAWRIAHEDPLLPAQAGALPGEIPLQDWHKSYSNVGSESTFPPGALSYLGHVRWGLVPLLTSVILLAQLFRRRDLAFLALLTAAVLLGAAADRYTVGVHLRRLADSTAPSEERALALDSLETTFFYRPGALAAARRLAADAAEPELLRKKAASAVQRLEGR